jgi:hypothetical protein
MLLRPRSRPLSSMKRKSLVRDKVVPRN